MAPPQARVISLRNVTPNISKNPIHLEELKHDLATMRCEGLLECPWVLKREQLAQEMVQPKRPNIFDGTIRDRPHLWTADLWRDTYNFPRGGSSLSNRMEGHHKGRFMNQVDSKDEYSVGDCRNDRQRRLLKFLVSIVHPDKPTRVTITIGNTIFGALDDGREVDWGVVFWDMAQRLEGGWEIQTHPHLPISVSFVRGSRSAYGRRGVGLPDGQGDGRIPDHSGSGFAARNRRGRACSNFSAIASTGTIADTQPEEEIDVQGAIQISSGPVQGTFKPSSTGNSAEGATIGFSTGRRTGMGGETLRWHSEELPASAGPI